MARKRKSQAARADRGPTEPGLQGTPVQLKRDRELLKLGYTFDTDEADRVCEFFECYLRHSKGEWAGRPFIPQDWQRRVLRRLFGWKRPDGTRRYRKLYMELARKNGKSTFAAGIALLLTFADRELGAEVYGAATDKEQARIVYREAKAMVEASPELKERSQALNSAIIVPETLSSYQPISSEARTKDGLNPHGVIIDELHEWGPKHRILWEKLTTAQGARRQPLIAMFTTAGDDPNSLWAEERDYAQKVADGRIQDDEYLAVIYCADPKDDWHDPEVWKKANPGYGVTVKADYLASQHRQAVLKPRYVPVFKRYHLNIMTSDSAGGLPMEAWDRCAGAVDRDELLGCRCYGAMDLSRRVDMSSVVFVFPGEDGSFTVLPRFYIPAEMIENKEQVDKVPMRLWVEQGLVVATPGNVIDYSYIRADILAAARDFELVELAYDPYGATQLAIELQDLGIECVEHRQGFVSMSEPTKKLEELLHRRKIRHGGNPVLRWHASNVALSMDASENIKPDKKKSAGRIDGIVALIMALGRATLHPDSGSVYEDHGIRTL